MLLANTVFLEYSAVFCIFSVRFGLAFDAFKIFNSICAESGLTLRSKATVLFIPLQDIFFSFIIVTVLNIEMTINGIRLFKAKSSDTEYFANVKVESGTIHLLNLIFSFTSLVVRM